MTDYVTISAPEDLLPQVVGELLAFTTDPNHVDVVHAETGRVVRAHPAVAEAWFQARQQPVEQVKEPSKPEPAPVKPSTGVPRETQSVSPKTPPAPSKKPTTSA